MALSSHTKVILIKLLGGATVLFDWSLFLIPFLTIFYGTWLTGQGVISPFFDAFTIGIPIYIYCWVLRWGSRKALNCLQG